MTGWHAAGLQHSHQFLARTATFSQTICQLFRRWTQAYRINLTVLETLTDNSYFLSQSQVIHLGWFRCLPPFLRLTKQYRRSDRGPVLVIHFGIECVAYILSQSVTAVTLIELLGMCRISHSRFRLRIAFSTASPRLIPSAAAVDLHTLLSLAAFQLTGHERLFPTRKIICPPQLPVPSHRLAWEASA